MTSPIRARLAGVVAKWRSLTPAQRLALHDAVDGTQLDGSVGPVVRLILFRQGLIDRQGQLTKQGQFVRVQNLDVPVDPGG
jgi:hypothetical protein